MRNFFEVYFLKTIHHQCPSKNEAKKNAKNSSNNHTKKLHKHAHTYTHIYWTFVFTTKTIHQVLLQIYIFPREYKCKRLIACGRRSDFLCSLREYVISFFFFSSLFYFQFTAIYFHFFFFFFFVFYSLPTQNCVVG